MLRVGVDFGGTKIAYGLFDDTMRLVERHRVKTDASQMPEASIAEMAREIGALVERNGHSVRDLSGVGIGFPCHIDYDEGMAVIATNLPMWEEVPLTRLLSERLGVPVWLDNDTNTAALAEHTLGAGQGAKHMAYMTISTGVGCGFIINGGLFRGTHGFAGELGQVFVSDTHGYSTKRTNAGVVQSIASGPQLARHARKQVEAGRESSILTHAGSVDAIDCVHIGMALAENDPLACEIVDHAALYLGRALVNLFELMDIGVIVYGGGVTKLGLRLIDGMIDTFYSLCRAARKRPVEYRPAALGDDAGLIGAALLVEG